MFGGRSIAQIRAEVEDEIDPQIPPLTLCTQYLSHITQVKKVYQCSGTGILSKYVTSGYFEKIYCSLILVVPYFAKQTIIL